MITDVNYYENGSTAGKKKLVTRTRPPGPASLPPPQKRSLYTRREIRLLNFLLSLKESSTDEETPLRLWCGPENFWSGSCAWYYRGDCTNKTVVVFVTTLTKQKEEAWARVKFLILSERFFIFLKKNRQRTKKHRCDAGLKIPNVYKKATGAFHWAAKWDIHTRQTNEIIIIINLPIIILPILVLLIFLLIIILPIIILLIIKTDPRQTNGKIRANQ